MGRLINHFVAQHQCARKHVSSISGLVVEYIIAIDVTQVRFLADAYGLCAEKPAMPSLRKIIN